MRAAAALLMIACAVRADDRGPTPEQRVVDVLWFQNGDRLLGLSLGEDAGGKVHFLVERAALKRQNPKQFDKYAETELADEKKSVSDALKRLSEWSERRRDQKTLQAFLLDEKERLAKRSLALLDGNWTPPTLAYLEVPRKEVRRIHSPPAERRSLCARAWQAGVVDVAKKTAKSIADELKKAGFADAAAEPDLSDLVGAKPQDDEEWAVRMAVVESIHGPRCKLQGTQGFLVGVGRELDLGDIARALQSAISGEQSNPLPDAIRKAESDGCTGLRIDTAGGDGNSAMMVTVHFFVRRPNGKWKAVYRQSERQSTANVDRDVADRVEKDPQVGSAERILKGLGLGDETQWATAKRAGAATAAALERANRRFEHFAQVYGRRIERPRFLTPAGN